jgi:hypothetical protein
MDKNLLAQREKLSAHLIKHLNRRRMAASFVPTAEAAKAEVLHLVRSMDPKPTSIMRCGSESIGSLGLWTELAALPGVTFLDPYRADKTPAENADVRRRTLLADVMVSSTNALTMDGRLVNLDGTGNRVAAMIFGPLKVILVVGMNKVVADLDAAYARIRTVAAPANNIRIESLYPGVKNPCMEDGRCHQCASDTKICNIWTTIEGSSVKDRIHVVLVGEDMGF